MIRKLFIYLADKVYPETICDLENQDFIICSEESANLFFERGINCKVFDAKDDVIERKLCNKIIEFSSGVDGGIVENQTPFLNEYYAYALRPAALILSSIDRLAGSGGFDKIVIIAPSSKQEFLPLAGCRTKETGRGSRYLFNAVMANIVVDHLSGRMPVERRYTKGDLFCIDICRKFFLNTANTLFSIVFIMGCFALSLLSFLQRAGGREGMCILARTYHQIRHAEIFYEKNKKNKILVFPQATNINLIPILVYAYKLKKEGALAKLPVLSIVKGLMKFLRESRCMRHKEERSTLVHLYGKSLVLDYDWFRRETLLVSVVRLYKDILFYTMLASPRKTLSFEISGRMAGFEYFVAESTSTTLVAYQTVLLADRVLPIFPFAHVFCSDSKENKAYLDNIGVSKKGEVVFAGNVFGKKNIDHISKVKGIGFFTQPYGYECTKSIMDSLFEWAGKNDARLVVKLHPRDSIKKYNMPSGVTVSEEKDPMKVAASVDVIVTKTSSVAKEALLAGKPAILCLWAKEDQILKSDYFGVGLEVRPVSFDKHDLFELLSNTYRLVEAGSILAESFSSEDGPEELINYLECI